MAFQPVRVNAAVAVAICKEKQREAGNVPGVHRPFIYGYFMENKVPAPAIHIEDAGIVLFDRGTGAAAKKK